MIYIINKFNMRPDKLTIVYFIEVESIVLFDFILKVQKKFKKNENISEKTKPMTDEISGLTLIFSTNTTTEKK